MRYANILETVGNTPMIELKSFNPRPEVHIFAKLEGVNPSGSIKDRIAKKMIEQAESQHLLTGVARRLKRHDPTIRVVAAEPVQGDSIQGLRNLADGFVPPVLDLSVIDARLLVSSRDAWMRTLQLKAQEGIFAGPSSGAVLEVALRVAATMDRGKIVIILADGGWKYMSEDHWMAKLPLPSSVVATMADKVAL